MDAAPTTVSSQRDLVNLYGDLTHKEEDNDFEASELYDAVLTGAVNQEKKFPTKVCPPAQESPAKQENSQSRPMTKQATKSSRKLSLYVGNFPWWTSDTDIFSLAKRLGVNTITEIKFAENKVNGQSRGYAEVVVSSEDSLKVLLEKIPQCELHGERLNCRFATQQNLSVFEDVANKRLPLRDNSKDSKDSNSTTVEAAPQVQPSFLPPPPFVNRLPILPSPFFGHPPPPFPHIPVPPNIPPPVLPQLFPPPPLTTTQPAPSLHINPAFFTPAQDSQSTRTYSQQNSDGEFGELMNRNKAIASSAITKAVSGATAGDLRMAMETLLTAIAIIKQSRVYGDERCQALVTSLKDCLVSIQGNYGYRSSSGSRERERERDRGRDRERDREREREDSYGREAAGMSRRHRERSWSWERNRERTGERDRHREHRDRYR